MLNTLKNAFLAFLALIDFPMEFRCWQWGDFPDILTFDACMKVGTDFITSTHLEASRPERDIDTDLVSILLKLTLVSPIFFGGLRVAFVMVDGVNSGDSPTWIGPRSRVSEMFHKSARGKTAAEDVHKTGDGKALVKYLEDKGGIGAVDKMDRNNLQALHRKCFSTGVSK